MKHNKNKGFFSIKYGFSIKMASMLIFAAFLGAMAFPVPVSVFAQENINSQKLALAEPNIGPGNIDGNSTDFDTSDINAAGTTLTPQVGPLGSTLDMQNIPENSGQIFVYTVRKGDTLSSLAQMFNVTQDTIVYANDLSVKQPLKIGSILAIPPISGQIYTAKSGDTIFSVAKKFQIKASDIAIYNDLNDDSDLSDGETLIIPNSDFTQTQVQQPKVQKSTPKNNTNSGSSVNSSVANEQDLGDTSGPLTAHPMRVAYKPDLGNALLRPVSIEVSRRTQGAHNQGTAVDLGAPIGTPIVAAADGVVVLARSAGYNGGYGKYVIIMSEIDGNTVQTIYAHMSEVLTTVGSQVKRGEIIGRVGSTGNSTGPHVHFEVHGALNPLIADPNYTGE